MRTFDQFRWHTKNEFSSGTHHCNDAYLPPIYVKKKKKFFYPVLKPVNSTNPIPILAQVVRIGIFVYSTDLAE